LIKIGLVDVTGRHGNEEVNKNKGQLIRAILAVTQQVSRL